MLTPKAKFLAYKDLVNRHLDTVQSESFKAASTAALLQFLDDAPANVDPIAAAANYNRLIGARDFLDKLIKIGDVAEIPKSVEQPKLTHNSQSQAYASRSTLNR
jgi:hypothetical protein